MHVKRSKHRSQVNAWLCKYTQCMTTPKEDRQVCVVPGRGRTGAQQPLSAAQPLVQTLRNGHRRPRQALWRRRRGAHGALPRERRTQAPFQGML